MPVEHDIIRTSKVNGVVVATSLEQIFADGAPSYSFGVLPGVANQQAAIPITLAKLQSLYILASQPTTMSVNGTNAVQSVTITAATGGTFTLSYGGFTTTPIAWNATAATVLASLSALTSIGTGNVAVSGVAGGPWSVTFLGTLGIQVVTAMTYSATSLTGVTPTLAEASTTTGVLGTNAVQSVTIGGSPTGGTFTLSYGGYTTAGIAWNAAASAVQSALVALTSIGAGNVAVTGTGPYSVTFTGALASQPITLMTGSATGLTGGTPTITLASTTTGVVGTNAVQSVTVTAATGGTFTLTFGGYTTSTIAWNAAASVVQTALQALTSIGSGNATVSGSAGGPYSVTFAGALASQPIATMTGSATSLTGVAPTIAVASTTVGVVPSQTITLAGGIALDWSLQAGYFANPLTANVVNLWFTNANTVSSAIAIQCPQNT